MTDPHINTISHKRSGELLTERETKKERGQTTLTNVLKDVDDKERRDQVVDALYVAAGRMADGPDKQDPLKNLMSTHKHIHKDIIKIYIT